MGTCMSPAVSHAPPCVWHHYVTFDSGFTLSLQGVMRLWLYFINWACVWVEIMTLLVFSSDGGMALSLQVTAVENWFTECMHCVYEKRAHFFFIWGNHTKLPITLVKSYICARWCTTDLRARLSAGPPAAGVGCAGSRWGSSWWPWMWLWASAGPGLKGTGRGLRADPQWSGSGLCVDPAPVSSSEGAQRKNKYFYIL